MKGRVFYLCLFKIEYCGAPQYMIICTHYERARRKIMFSVASFFAGVGGIDLGFEETGEFKTVYANEFDSYASETFEMNYPTVKVDQRDIHLVPVEDVPKTDVIIGGFPCQAFSIAGYRQ